MTPYHFFSKCCKRLSRVGDSSLFKTMVADPTFRKSDKGFTLLLAALVSSIALALGVAVFEIAIKQIELSSMGRDSQFAFYTADSAAECALYWDYRYSYFSPTPSPDTPANVTCDGRTITISDRPAEPMPSTYTYTIGIGDMNLFTDATPGNLCARVTVTKTRGADNIVRSIIHADGFNDDCSSLAENPRAIQRSVEIRY